MEKLCKFLVRLTIIFTSLYFIVVFAIALAFETSFHNDMYVVLLELCLAVFTSVQGNYHCKYARYTAWGIFSSDSVTRLDAAYDFIPIGNTAIVSSVILGTAIATSIFLAFCHFIRVQKLKTNKRRLYEDRRRNERENG